MDSAAGDDPDRTAAPARSRGDLYLAIQHDGQRMAAGLIRMLHTMSAASDLHPTDLQCYSLLRMGGPMTPGEIAHGLRLATGSVTELIDRLVRHGLVVRDRHSEDRRKVIVRPASEPATEGEQSSTGLREAMVALHDHYSTAELEIISDWLARLGDTLAELAERPPSPDQHIGE